MNTLTLLASLFMMFSPMGGEVTELKTPYGEVQTVEEYVRDYFSDEPILAEIARCESTFRHFDEEGNIIRGNVNNSDVGVMQINTYYHEKSADAFGYDLFTLEGNLGYARNLFEREGTEPWSASKFCWGDHPHLAAR